MSHRTGNLILQPTLKSEIESIGLHVGVPILGHFLNLKILGSLEVNPGILGFAFI